MRARRAGFTLLEITVTLAILGIIMTIVFGVFAQTMAGKQHTEQRGEELASARATLSRISADLANLRLGDSVRALSTTATALRPAAQPQATPTPLADAGMIRPETGLFLGRIRTDHGVAVDDIAFSALLRRPTAVTYTASDLGIVHYFVDTSSEDPREHGLYREAVYSLAGEAFDPDKPDLGATMLVLPGVVGLDLRYFDGKDWVDEWDSTDSRDFGPAPFAVQIQLAVANEQGEVDTYQTAVDLPVMRTLKKAKPGAAVPTPSR